MKQLRFLLVVAILVCTALFCLSCSDEGDTTTAGGTEGTPATTSTEAATTTAATTRITSGEIDIAWNFGYVGSDTNANYKNKIADGGGMYSYSDVITIERKGTKIIFIDDNTDSNNDKNYASAAAYVISSWKQEGDNWVIDLENANISGSANGNSDIANISGGKCTYTYITSRDNECIRLCYRSGQSDTFTPTQRPVVSFIETDEPGTFAQTVGGLDLWAAASREESYYEQLEGITINALGDSYFAGNGLDSRLVWPALLSKKYNMNFKNYGANGSAICSYDPGRNPMVNRYNTMANNNPNIVLIEGGRNDYNVNAPIGTNADTDPSKSYKGGVNYLIDKVKEKYPNALIICVTNWKVTSRNSINAVCTDYAVAMREVCEAKGVPCFYAADPSLSGVDMDQPRFRLEYCMNTSDVSHLNSKGHKMVLPAFEKFIAEEYAKFLASK